MGKPWIGIYGCVDSFGQIRLESYRSGEIFHFSEALLMCAEARDHVHRGVATGDAVEVVKSVSDIGWKQFFAPIPFQAV